MMEKGKHQKHCAIFECEKGHVNGNLISCCRYRLTDKFREGDWSNTVFVFLIHLPKKCLKSNFVSFQEQPWLCYHVDAMFPTDNTIPLSIILSGEVNSMSDIYYGEGRDILTCSSTNVIDANDDQPLQDHYLLLPPSGHKGINLCKRMYLHISEAASNPEQVNQLTKIVPQRIEFPLTGQ